MPPWIKKRKEFHLCISVSKITIKGLDAMQLPLEEDALPREQWEPLFCEWRWPQSVLVIAGLLWFVKEYQEANALCFVARLCSASFSWWYCDMQRNSWKLLPPSWTLSSISCWIRDLRWRKLEMLCNVSSFPVTVSVFCFLDAVCLASLV